MMEDVAACALRKAAAMVNSSRNQEQATNHLFGTTSFAASMCSSLVAAHLALPSAYLCGSSAPEHVHQEDNFDFTPPDTVFSSWRSWSPDLHKLPYLPPIPIVPRVDVFCDESKLTVLVDKSANGLSLTGEEMQLGDGCYSNKELPNQFVFTYSLDECGTTPVRQNGLVMFTNSLHLNLRMPPTTWWQTHPTRLGPELRPLISMKERLTQPLIPGASAMVSTSPLVVVDKPTKVHLAELQEASSAPVADPVQSDRLGTKGTLVSGNSALRPIRVVSLEQDATPALWLPAHMQNAELGQKIGSESKDNLKIMLQSGDGMSNEIQPSATDQEPLLKTPTHMVIAQSANEVGRDAYKWDLNDLTLFDGWAIKIPKTGKATLAEESQRRKRFGRSGSSDAEVQQDEDFPLMADMDANVLVAKPQEEANAAQPILRSKLQFSKGTDGSQTLSYEEEVLGQEVKGGPRRFRLDGIKRKAESRQRRLHSIFLDLLR
ncbi:hypothetical protein EYF80_006728 [Liparis tanakae]|uniref:ZP-N domain-containing protein n=1 Tax=Liparis tanakae TaxID=230148 RepID=A0A4Z2IZA5_9TELE|nr:hypothetical protein EYF80_006728 [Liparis tanakae]